MPNFFYLLQVSLCSLVLYVYYYFFLRHNRSHSFNRFYLLSIFILSWLIPLIRIPVGTGNVTRPITQPFHLKMFEVIADTNSQLDELVVTNRSVVDMNDILHVSYWLVSLTFAILFILRILRLYLLSRQKPKIHVEGALVLKLDDSDSPFSFFHFIFWNTEIKLSSEIGKKILEHELVHIKQKHSVDKIVAAAVLSVGWINPIFWLIKKELEMVHEFIADRKTVKDDPSQLAQMLLAASFPSHAFNMTHSFFHSPIKRRISMVSKTTLSRYARTSKLFILPVFVIVIALFSFRKDTRKYEGTKAVTYQKPNEQSANDTNDIRIVDVELSDKASPIHSAELKRTYSIIIDAGHGGSDHGAQAKDGTNESDIALGIVKILLEENHNELINLIPTRTDDVYQSPSQKSEFIKKNNADALLSIHTGSSMDATDEGIQIFIPSEDSSFRYDPSYILANTLANPLSQFDPQLQIKRRKVGSWALSDSFRPAILIETGFLTNERDLTLLRSEQYQRKIAQSILKGIELYLQLMQAEK